MPNQYRRLNLNEYAGFLPLNKNREFPKPELGEFLQLWTQWQPDVRLRAIQDQARSNPLQRKCSSLNSFHLAIQQMKIRHR